MSLGLHPRYHPHHFPTRRLQRPLRRLRLRLWPRGRRAHRHDSDHHRHFDVAWAALAYGTQLRDVRYWHKADIGWCTAHVPFRG